MRAIMLAALGAMASVLIVLASVLAATVPILAYLMFVWWLDRYEREPIWLVSLPYLLVRSAPSPSP